MAGFDGEGTFVRTRDITDDVAAAGGTLTISAPTMDEEFDAIASGLSNCITKDGQTNITANIDWNNKRIVSLADPVDSKDAANKSWTSSNFVASDDGVQSINGNLRLSATTSEARTLTLGYDRSVDGDANINMRTDTSSTYNLQIKRNNGSNGTAEINHSGTGNFTIQTEDAANLRIAGNGTTCFTARSDGFCQIDTVCQLQDYTVAQLNALSPPNRSIAYCSNGDAGSRCLAFYNGTAWKVLAVPGADISET